MTGAFIGTTDGVFALRDGALERLGLERRKRHARCTPDADGLLAGTYGDGLFRSADGGRSWEPVTAGLTASTFRFVTAELAGTEPARLFRSPDGGQSWDEYEGITRIPGHEDWYLPYSPRAGAARNALVAGDRLLVAAEVAGLLRSDDGGRTWACEPVAGDEDIHHVTAHPDDPDLRLRLARHRVAAAPGRASTAASPARATAAGRGRRSRPTTRARRSSRPRGRTCCSPAPRRASAPRGASSSPPTAATPGSRPATASTCRCPTWSSCSSTRPTARCGRSARAAACCARRPASGRGARRCRPDADVTVKSVAFA